MGFFRYISAIFDSFVMMNFVEFFLIALGLAMDAFAVSVSKGLCTKRLQLKHYLIAGLWFGGFQAIMPLIGYLLGVSFASYVNSVDHWIEFILLSVIGGNMIKESFEKGEDSDSKGSDFGYKTMLMMATATSIDALAVGVSFAFLQVNIMEAALIIGVVTFVMAALGIKIGNIFGLRYKKKAEFTGGLLLILMGIKFLVEHLI